MRTTVIVNGASGKMGIAACQALQTHPDFELVGQLGRHDDLFTTIKTTQAKIVVDLTRADSVYQNTCRIIEAGAHPVIGTSGLLPEQIETLKIHCQEKELGGIIVPNFSLGAVLMMRFAAEAAQYFPEVEIIEAHHPQKQDAPSGTAVKTAALIAKHRKISPAKTNCSELISGARGAVHQDIHIHALRLPGVLAQQQVIFGGSGETLSIVHNSLDRGCFMPGLIFACQEVLKLKELCYGLETLMRLSSDEK